MGFWKRPPLGCVIIFEGITHKPSPPKCSPFVAQHWKKVKRRKKERKKDDFDVATRMLLLYFQVGLSLS
jgi:hypothetical protein